MGTPELICRLSEVWVAWGHLKCSWHLKSRQSCWGSCSLTYGVGDSFGWLMPELDCSVPRWDSWC